MATWIPGSVSASPAPDRGYGWRAGARAFGREPVAVLGLAMVVLYALVAVGVDLLPLRDPLAVSAQRLAAPSPEFPFGTDALGRDLFSRVLFGARLSMQVATLSVAAATLVGGVLGLAAGYVGGLLDLLIGRVMDVFFAFPATSRSKAAAADRGDDTSATEASATAKKRASPPGPHGRAVSNGC